MILPQLGSPDSTLGSCAPGPSPLSHCQTQAGYVFALGPGRHFLTLRTGSVKGTKTGESGGLSGLGSFFPLLSPTTGGPS